MSAHAFTIWHRVVQDDDYRSTPLLASAGGVLGSIWSNDTVDSAVAANPNVVTTGTDDGGLVAFIIDTNNWISALGGNNLASYESESNGASVLESPNDFYRTCPECSADCTPEPLETEYGMRGVFACKEHGLHTGSARSSKTNGIRRGMLTGLR